MEQKNIIIGLVIGVLIGAIGIYLINQSKISQLNKQISALESEAESLNDVISNNEEIIEAKTITVNSLQDELKAKDDLIAEYEEYKQNAELLVSDIVEDFNIVNYMCARQTYRAEKALNLLVEHLPEYEPEHEPISDFEWVFGEMPFEDWWDQFGGPFENWYKYVYP